jgi:hypothetical protein
MSESATMREIERSQPYRPDGSREEHADDAQRLLKRLREVGAAGITTGELIREGCCGLRPPNRAGDLRRQGHLIETIREGNGVFRYRLIRENPNPQPLRRGKKAQQKPLPDSSDWFVRSTGIQRPSADASADLPLFHRGGNAA